MNIASIIKITQPLIYNKLINKYKLNLKKRTYSNRKVKYDEDLSFSYIESLMKNRAYKRVKGGGIRQVR